MGAGSPIPYRRFGHVVFRKPCRKQLLELRSVGLFNLHLRHYLTSKSHEIPYGLTDVSKCRTIDPHQVSINGDKIGEFDSTPGSTFQLLGIEEEDVSTVTLESLGIDEDEFIGLLEVSGARNVKGTREGCIETVASYMVLYIVYTTVYSI